MKFIRRFSILILLSTCTIAGQSANPVSVKACDNAGHCSIQIVTPSRSAEKDSSKP